MREEPRRNFAPSENIASPADGPRLPPPTLRRCPRSDPISSLRTREHARCNVREYYVDDGRLCCFTDGVYLQKRMIDWKRGFDNEVDSSVRHPLRRTRRHVPKSRVTVAEPAIQSLSIFVMISLSCATISRYVVLKCPLFYGIFTVCRASTQQEL